ncbi:MAG: RNA polymerase subunit sigma, partial [Bacteroidota bacterium]|nr:RNA polymerase subunit sigma [Bacteroidota bacterium]
MSQAQLIPHLFRNESRKITSVLCKCFGIEFLQVAEDITHDTFLKALETWTYKGVPPDPVAWLYVVAKNQARNYLKRNTLFLEKISPALQYLNSERQDMDIDTSDQHIRDSELQMLFAICHPSISSESQVGLALKILCGFGIDEIATAFLTSREVINKRLFRAK